MLPQKAIAPEKVLQTFNTWAFKREQPDTPELLLRTISDSISLGRPLSFVLYWGKGPRSEIAEPEIACLDYLASLDRRVCDVYGPGAAFKLICTDTHAELNGYSPQDIRDYFATVDAAARARGFDSCWLGDLVRAGESAGAADVTNETVSDDTLNRLTVCAAKWFRGEGSVKDGAAKYYQMNMIEKRAVQFAFPHSIFITFNGSEFRAIFPERLPIFYMYSIKRGVSIKPWFMPATITSPETAPV
jgi:hypothetical protein